MPKKSNTKTIARKPRKGIRRRANKPADRCKKSIIQKNVTTVECNTLFTVRFAPKIGYQVLDEVNPFEKEVPGIAGDLLRSINCALKVLFNEKPLKIDPEISHSELMEKLIDILNKRIVPAGFKYNIERKEGYEYVIVLYKEMDFDWCWHYFCIQNIIKQLEKDNPALLKIYLSALNGLRKVTNIPTWFGGNCYGYDVLIEDDFGFEDHLANNFDMDDPDDEEGKNELIACREDYKNGEAKKYMELICKASYKVKGLRAQLCRFRTNPAIRKLIDKILTIVETGISIYEFDYDPLNSDEGEYWDGEPLQLNQQLTIVWGEDDPIFKCNAEQIDLHAGEFGVIGPSLFITLDHKLNKKHFENLDKKINFWLLIRDLFQYNYQIHRNPLKKVK